ncbi:MAG: 8-oxoguanine DNA glycosylase [Candidatus Micrarchaeota archaeon]|nr:8-oxoguanine DNA glycosylase [Candidatus Micrarchaeota archaeon]
MPAITIPVSCFSLEHTMLSGQPPFFLMSYEKGAARFPVEGSIVSLQQNKHELNVEWKGDASEEEIREVVEDRFRLKDDMKLIYKSLIKDEFMLKAIAEFYGLRLTLSDPWETLASFICSTNNNLRNIKCIVGNLSRTFGEKIEAGGESFYRFPDALSISQASLKSLKQCKLGFRAEYLKNAAKACSSRIDLSCIAGMSYNEGRMELMRMKGVGEKIADCVLLFSYGKLESFPIDVWVRRTMGKAYFKNKNTSDKEIAEFAREYWDGYAGYAQQYVFWYGRNMQHA